MLRDFNKEKKSPELTECPKCKCRYIGSSLSHICKDVHPDPNSPITIGQLLDPSSTTEVFLEEGNLAQSTPLEQEFTKYDGDKLKMSLVDPDFIIGVADILTFGANKYSKNNWQKNTDIDRYKDSTLRHLYSYLNGEFLDSESGKPHLDHIATNLMFLRYFEHGKGRGDN